GTAPFSEPETQAIREFINSRDFHMCLDYHAYGMLLLYPWCYDYLYTPDHNLFVALTDTMSALNGHTSGTSWELLYPVNGGSIDWEYGEQTEKPKIMAITPEVGTGSDGFWPAESRIDPLCELELPANLLYAEFADNPYRVLPPASPVLLEMDTVQTPDYQVNWSFHDTLNPAASFELMEMTGFERITYDVESGYSDWNLNGFTISTSRSHSPTHSFYSGQGNQLDNRATTQNSIGVTEGDTLTFWCWYRIESDWDYAYVEISTDGGNTFFSIPGNITTNYNPNGTNRGNGITGSSSAWVEGVFDLSDWAGENIFLRFRYITDQYYYLEGFYTDDIFPFERYENQIVLSDAITDTFYQIEDQSPGTYYYKVRAKDLQDQIGPWSNVEDVVVWETFVRGDANGDGEIDISDAIYLVNYLFIGGPEPVPLEAGDVNSDGEITSADVIYLINYLFQGGPPPGK
ncbi:MAG: M14 family zinc carboxypeptidase, partial [Candidatus Zixiibacteriota bacterium]